MGRTPTDHRPGDDDGCPILHVDMDAFFASVELRRRPELRGKPIIVGGVGNRGVVSSASYEARAYGVHSAMPAMQARRLCPHGIFLPVDGSAYHQASAHVMDIFHGVTPLVEQISVDEAFLDVAGAYRLMGSPAQIAANLREQVRHELGLTCSVGVAATKFIAKLASTRCKPDGLLVVPKEQTLNFLHPLPVQALWGVGGRTQAVLTKLGLRTVGELAHLPLSALRKAVGDGAAHHLYELAWGRDPRRVNTQREERSIGAEETYSQDLIDHASIGRELLRLANRVAARLRRARYCARTIALKVRFADFTTITRARTLPQASDLGRDLYTTALNLWCALNLDKPRIRLLGIRGENLIAAAHVAEQLPLGAAEHSWRELQEAVDEAELKFGSGVVRPATLIHLSDQHRHS